MYEELPLDALIENPMNSNKISRMYAKKLRHNIGDVGFYETLTVRPHPLAKDKFEVLNGHAHLAVLRDLGLSVARCDIWEVDDAQAILFLAILNKLRGSEVPELRMNLLFSLLEEHSEAELAAHIPETKPYLARLKQIPEEEEARADTERGRPDVVIISFYLPRSGHDLLNLALDHIMQEHKLADSSAALVKMAEMYLASTGKLKDLQAAI